MIRGSILVVDDDALFRAALDRYLGSEGYDVTVAKNPDEALASLGQHAFDVVLTDLKMPGLDGVALVRRIRELDPSVVCVVITGFGRAKSA